ncbi:DUF3137 domain-containing protein [Cohnella lupini]|uniref:Uncharacterized protein DUF3137 n=1 Tax=Cohnella lupini TaxID=1294267 RepID=A0A3D9HQH0_9BACL|nr:DUF3137 domain-containing protein [Cohnella lupini]RED51166.1 uncharacterized protein DUF3137 [Cohnella lupini]
MWPTFEEFLQEARMDLNRLERIRTAYLERRSRAIRRIFVPLTVLVIAFFVNVLAVLGFNQGWGVFGILFVLIGGLWWLVRLFRTLREYRGDIRTAKAEFEQYGSAPLAQAMGLFAFQQRQFTTDCGFEYEGGETFRHGGLLEGNPLFALGYDSIRGLHNISGKRYGRDFAFSEIRVTRKETSSEGDYTATLFRGALFAANLNEENEQVVFLRPKVRFPDLKKIKTITDGNNHKIKLRSIETGNVAFNRAFAIRASDESSALDMLSNDWMQWLLSFRDRYGKRITILFAGSRITIAVSSTRTRFPFKPGRSTERNLRSAYEGLRFALELIVRSLPADRRNF